MYRIYDQARVAPVVGIEVLEPHNVRASAESERARLLGRALSGWWKQLVVSHRQRIACRQLAALDDRLLQDIGIERSQIAMSVNGVSQGHIATHHRGSF